MKGKSKLKRKAIAAAALLAISCAFSTACQPAVTGERPPVYKSANVEVSLADDADVIRYADYYWSVLTEDMAYTKNTVILSGVASNIRQATVTYEYRGRPYLTASRSLIYKYPMSWLVAPAPFGREIL